MCIRDRNTGAFALVELLSGPGAPSGLHARSHSISSIKQLPCKQLLDAQRASLPRSEAPATPTLLTPKAAGGKKSVTTGILGFCNQSFLSSRSHDRITQGVLPETAATLGLGLIADRPPWLANLP